MSKHFQISTFVLATLLSLPAFAGSAVVESGAGADRQRAELEYRDSKLRVQAQGQADGTMILRDGRIYTIAEGMVIDLAGMAGMMGQAGMNTISSGPDDLVRYLGLDNTGRSEPVAGVAGKVHLLRYVDRSGKPHSEELVLSADPRARELGEALQLMSTGFREILGQPEAPGEAQLQDSLKGQGVLRYGKEFRVVSFGSTQPSPARFELPSAPQQLPSLGAFGGGAPAEAAPASGGGGLLGRVLGGKAQRQQERIEGRTEQETDAATDRAVDSVLDKAFGKIFGE